MRFRRLTAASLVTALVLGVGAVAWSKNAPTGPDPIVRTWLSWPHPVTCGGISFDPIQVFSSPTGAEKGTGGAERALRRFLRQPGWGWIPDHHWRLVANDGKAAEFVQGRLSQHVEREMSALSFENEGGKWKWAGSGGCIPRTVRSGLPAAEWDLYRELGSKEATTEVDFSTETLVVGIEERACHGFTDPLKRLQRPEVRYTDTAALVTFWVQPLRGPAFCPAPPPSRYELTLPGPLGDRTLFDAGTYPPRVIATD